MKIINSFLVVVISLEIVASYPSHDDNFKDHPPAPFPNIANLQNKASNPEYVATETIATPTLISGPHETNSQQERGIYITPVNEKQENNNRLAFQELVIPEYAKQLQVQDNKFLLGNQPLPASKLSIHQQEQRLLEERLANQGINRYTLARPGDRPSMPLLNTIAKPYLTSVPILNPYDESDAFEKVRQVYLERQQNNKEQNPSKNLRLSRPPPQQIEIKETSVPLQHKSSHIPYILNQQTHDTPNGYNSLQHLISTNPALGEVLASTKNQKRYLVIYPNGKVEHIDEIETIAKKHPNYVLVKEGTINSQENRAAAKIEPVSRSQSKANDVPSTTLLSASSSSSGTTADETYSIPFGARDNVSQSKSVNLYRVNTLEDLTPSETTVSPITVPIHDSVTNNNVKLHQESENGTAVAPETTLEIVSAKETQNSATISKTGIPNISIATTDTITDTNVSSETGESTKERSPKTVVPFTITNTSENITPSDIEYSYEIVITPTTLTLLKTSAQSKTALLQESVQIPLIVTDDSHETNSQTNETPLETPILYEVVSPPGTLAVFEADTLSTFSPNEVTASTETDNISTIKAELPTKDHPDTIHISESVVPSVTVTTPVTITKEKTTITKDKSSILHDTSFEMTTSDINASSNNEAATPRLTKSDVDEFNLEAPKSITSEDIASTTTYSSANKDAGTNLLPEHNQFNNAGLAETKIQSANISDSNSSKDNRENIPTKPIILLDVGDSEFWDQLLGDDHVNLIYFLYVPSKSNVENEESTSDAAATDDVVQHTVRNKDNDK